jgi:hypothetical protein
MRSMHKTLQNCPDDLIFNLDEVGISDWEDRKPKRVVVPLTVSAHKFHHRISRKVKHISIMTCISAISLNPKTPAIVDMLPTDNENSAGIDLSKEFSRRNVGSSMRISFDASTRVG